MENQNSFPKEDNQYKDCVIEKVVDAEDSCEIHLCRGGVFIFKKDSIPGFIPKADDVARLYGKGLGYPVRGLFINGRKSFYKTEEQQQEEHKKWVEETEQKEKANFEKNKKSMDEKYEKLPEFFKKRLDKLRKSNPEFRWKFEPYEMFVCEEAVKIATALKTKEEIEKWSSFPFKKQSEIIDEGHSGNTFDCAVALAKIFVSSPEFVPEMHGALAPLVGCKEYGCHCGEEKNPK